MGKITWYDKYNTWEDFGGHDWINTVDCKNFQYILQSFSFL